MKRRSLPNVNQSNAKKFSGPKKLPDYKIVEGTKFAVDAFCYGEIPGIEIYFLSHFHSDHYMGLNSKFNKTLYCSKITGELCVKKLSVKSALIKNIDIDEILNVDGITVTAVDANHCPGALMFVFQLKDGKKILHCGDFRACPDMELYPIIKEKNFDLIYLDTTYCNPKYDFPSQKESIDKAISILSKKKEAMERNGEDFDNLLVICGTYLIGKEKFFQGIAKHFDMNIWSEPKKKSDLKIVINLKTDFTAEQCHLHVLPMGDLNYDSISNHMKSLSNTFTECIAFKPTGWEHSGASFIQRNNITIFGVPYSEHSSFTEMNRFIHFCKPKRIISTIPNHESNKKVQGYLSSWIGPETRKVQTKINDFFKGSLKTTKT